MRIRTIKPEFFKHDGIAELPPLSRIFFIGLWCVADRDGRLEDRPSRLKIEILPYDTADADAILDQLARLGFIQRYSVGDVKVIQVVAFSRHQRISGKEAEIPSRFPEYTGEATVKHPGSNCEATGSPGREGKGKEGNKEWNGEVASAPVAVAPAPSEGGPKPARLRFQPPTLEQVKLQAAKIGLPDSDAIAFHSYYESNGWKVGKNPMRSWTAAMTTWKIKRDTNGYHRGRTEQVADDRNRFISDTRSDADKAADEAAFQARQNAHLARHRAMQGQ